MNNPEERLFSNDPQSDIFSSLFFQKEVYAGFDANFNIPEKIKLFESSGGNNKDESINGGINNSSLNNSNIIIAQGDTEGEISGNMATGGDGEGGTYTGYAEGLLTTGNIAVTQVKGEDHKGVTLPRSRGASFSGLSSSSSGSNPESSSNDEVAERKDTEKASQAQDGEHRKEGPTFNSWGDYSDNNNELGNNSSGSKSSSNGSSGSSSSYSYSSETDASYSYSDYSSDSSDSESDGDQEDVFGGYSTLLHRGEDDQYGDGYGDQYGDDGDQFDEDYDDDAQYGLFIIPTVVSHPRKWQQEAEAYENLLKYFNSNPLEFAEYTMYGAVTCLAACSSNAAGQTLHRGNVFFIIIMAIAGVSFIFDNSLQKYPLIGKIDR